MKPDTETRRCSEPLSWWFTPYCDYFFHKLSVPSMQACVPHLLHKISLGRFTGPRAPSSEVTGSLTWLLPQGSWPLQRTAVSPNPQACYLGPCPAWGTLEFRSDWRDGAGRKAGTPGLQTPCRIPTFRNTHLSERQLATPGSP